MPKEILTRKSPRWGKFLSLLEGPKGCNFRQVKGRTTWTCNNKGNRPLATKILRSMGGVNIAGTLRECKATGGYCDCEILFNCDR